MIVCPYVSLVSIQSQQWRNSAMAMADVVIVEVGPERKQYHLYKALLTHHSEHFAKALTGNWKEADEGVIRLLDVEEQTCKSASESWY